MVADESPEAGFGWVFLSRLAVGLAQGLALYLLYLAVDDKSWPALDGFQYAPLLFFSLLVPSVALVSIGNLRATTLAWWLPVVTIVIACIAYYAIWHWPTEWTGEAYKPRLVPSFDVFFFAFVGLFIAQALVAGGDADRRFIARYTAHFDVAWKLGLQAALSIVFVGIFWGVLELGAALFNLIDIGAIEKLIEHRWFAIPATTLALAAGVHLTDARAGLVRGTRTLVLILLSWLLPLMTLIAAGFLASLVFTGLAPLWKTGFAAGYLLTAAGILVFLINAAYQDGDPARYPLPVLRYPARLAGVLLVPLVAISAYAIELRVAQYGWTTDRVHATACLVVAMFYAGGYAFAAVAPGPWLSHIARWNFFAALLVLATLAAIFSPLADTMRIAVSSQVARLESGRVKPDAFDFSYMRWNGGRFGAAALHELTTWNSGPYAAQIRAKAKSILSAQMNGGLTVTPLELSTNLTVYPRGQVLPQSFLKQKWDQMSVDLPSCLRTEGLKCDAYLLDLAGDGHKEIAIIGDFPAGGTFYSSALFAEKADGTWQLVGRPSPNWSCASIASALRSGKFELVTPQPPPWRDVTVAAQTLTVRSADPDSANCPK